MTQGLAYLEKAAAYNPFNADYHSDLMRVYLATGRPEQAVAEARRAAARSRYSAAKKADLALLTLAAGKYKEAVDYARQALAAAPCQNPCRSGWRRFCRFCRFLFILTQKLD